MKAERRTVGQNVYVHVTQGTVRRGAKANGSRVLHNAPAAASTDKGNVERRLAGDGSTVVGTVSPFATFASVMSGRGTGIVTSRCA